MGAAKYDLTIEQGATFSMNCTMKDSANATVDLTSWTFSGKIKETIASQNAVAEFTFTIANQGTNQGEFTITIPAATTALIPVNIRPNADRPLTQYFYDIEATKPDTTIDRILEGKVFVSPEVTK